MNIDLHCHTKATKKGDSSKRNISSIENFIKTLENNDVGICAITNHNHFDKEQFKKICAAESKIIFWPGVELDVKGKTSQGHCIMICNPTQLDKFEQWCKDNLEQYNPDTFLIDTENLSKSIDELDVICICHYGNKKPCLDDGDIDNFKESLKNKKPFFLETSNLRSAGILLAHNINALIGSDVQDWDKYKDYSLPQLKIPLDSFEKFKKLLQKDRGIIKTFIDEKLLENVKIKPFDDCEVELPIYNDVNIIFGGKGTGKTIFLESLEKYFISKGYSDIATYYAGKKSEKYSSIIEFNISDSDLGVFNIPDNINNDFNNIINFKDAKVTPITKFRDWIKTKNISKKNFGFTKCVFSTVIDNTHYNEYLQSYKNLKSNIQNLLKNILFQKNNKEDIEKFNITFSLIIENAKNELKKEFCRYNALKLEKFTIEKMKKLYHSKSGLEPKPSCTGLIDVYSNCKNIYNSSTNILFQLNRPSEKIIKFIGKLPDKGKIYCCKEISINPSLVFEKPKYNGGKKNNLKNIKEKLKNLQSHCFTSLLSTNVAKLNSELLSSNIKRLEDFLFACSYTQKENGELYNPSNGEQSMIVLNNALLDDNKEIFVLDEPEMSVGHKFINDIIVPRILELAKANKKIIISTHDANIAIRTLPFLSVYREDCGNGNYKTYIGSAFMENMNEYGKDNTISWAKTSMEVLEGGKIAFNERGETYGNEKY